jgi:hypothetical protein
VTGGLLGNVMGCVDYSVSGSGAVATHLGWWGMGGVASQPFTRLPQVIVPLMTVALPCASPLRLHSLCSQWLHVVQ